MAGQIPAEDPSLLVSRASPEPLEFSMQPGMLEERRFVFCLVPLSPVQVVVSDHGSESRPNGSVKMTQRVVALLARSDEQTRHRLVSVRQFAPEEVHYHP